MLSWIAVVALAVWGVKKLKEGVAESKALGLWCLFHAKVHELIDNPFTFDADWRQLIPVLEEVDDIVFSTMENSSLPRLADLAKRELYDRPEETLQ